MQHTLVAVFDNRNDAKQAMDELLASRFTSANVRLSQGDTADTADSPANLSGAVAQPVAAHEDDSIAASIRHFFSGIFGTDDSVHAQRYSSAVTRGHHVLTVGPVSEPEVERAADIVERFGPIDIDEESDGAEYGTAGADQIVRRDSASLQGSQPISFQNDDRAPFQQGNLNDAVPMGGTYQEPMGNNGNLGLSANQGNPGGQRMASSTGAMSMQDGTQQGSLQRDMGAAPSPAQPAAGGAAFAPTEIKRPGVRVFARDGGDVGNPDAGRLAGTGASTLGAGSGNAGGTSAGPGNAEGTNALQQQDNDAAYLAHYNSTYGNQGSKYDDVAPAYRYGSSLAADDRYRGRSWDDAESDIRTDWESRNAGSTSTWDKMKAAVRHGWERMTA